LRGHLEIILHHEVTAWRRSRRAPQRGFATIDKMTVANGSKHWIARSMAQVSAWVLLLVASSFAGPSGSSQGAAELVRKAVQNESGASTENGAHFLFRGTKTTPRGSTTRIYIETKDATAGLVIAYDGHPLTPQQRRDEESRVERFVNNPEELKKKRDQERDNTERTTRILRALPEAFLFEYAGEEHGGDGVGHAGDPLIRLRFRPNPNYQPPSRVEEVLAGMQGYVLIDPVGYRIAKIDGTLFREVGFGWGILGHLDRGGRFIVQQQEVGDHSWEVSGMTLKFTGKIMLVKSLNLNSTEVFGNFRRVPANLTFAQALELLKQEESTTTAETTERTPGTLAPK
jgi:hypothetical protein